MGRRERMEHYRDDRDYGSLLGDEDYEEEDVEKGDLAEPVPEREEENYSQECQEYYERRERLKELERKRFRRLNDNGKSTLKSTSKPLPYDNYGNFFGPSEPIVTRRIISDVRARETASKVAARQAQEVSEVHPTFPHRVSKGSSGMVSEARAVETARQPKVVNEQAVKLQQAVKLKRLKEARDYSFLFTDEDPAASPPRHEARASTKERQDDNRTKQPPSSAKGNSGVPPRGPKPLASISAKTSMGSKAVASKAQERHPTPTAKLAKPPERPPVLNSKVLSQTGSTSNLSKTTSGPGRPPHAQQARSNVSMPGFSNGKKPLPSSVTAQLKSLVAPGTTGAGKLSLPRTSAKPAPEKGPSLKSAPLGSTEKKLPQFLGSKSQASTSRPDQKRPGVVTVARGVSTGHHDQRRPAQTAASSKMIKAPPQKRPWESESEDSFIDDDDDGGDYRSAIRKMFRYNPNKYRDIDEEDDRSMEANFHTIQMEEKRSARIAREEDDRELALIEEEERREREMARKKRKQQR